MNDTYTKTKVKIKDFTDIFAWQKGFAMVIEIYEVTKEFPQSEMFAMTDQIRRSAISITSNIAEGFGRQSMKEKLQFYYISQGSLLELRNLLLIACELEYLNEVKYEKIYELILSTHKLLQGLIQSTKKLI